MDYSIIIPTYNSEKYIEKCLKSILSSLFNKKFEIIVVDDNSSDLTIEKVTALGVRLIKHKKNHGPSFSRNQGAKIANGNTLIFIDSDIMIYSDTLKKIDRFFAEKNDFSGVSGNYEPFCSMKNFISQFKNLLAYYARINQPKNVDWAQSSLFAIKASAFKSVGGFNEDLRHCEDVMLGKTLVQNNYNLAFCNILKIQHMKTYSFLSFLKERIERSQIRIVIRLSGKTKKMVSSKDSISSKSIYAMYLFLLLPTSIFLGQINIHYALIPFFSFYAVNFEFLSLCKTTFGKIFLIKSSFMILLDCTICWFGIFLGCIDFLKGRRI